MRKGPPEPTKPPAPLEGESVSGRDDASPGAAWPLRLSHLLQLLAGQLDAASRSSIRAEAWLLLHPTLSRYARLHAAKIGPIAKEEIEDLASSKSLDLLSRTESGMWNTSERSGPEIAGYLSKVALNGLRDRYRRESRFEPGLEGDFGDGNASDRPNPSVRVIASTTEAQRRCANALFDALCRPPHAP